MLYIFRIKDTKYRVNILLKGIITGTLSQQFNKKIKIHILDNLIRTHSAFNELIPEFEVFRGYYSEFIPSALFRIKVSG